MKFPRWMSWLFVAFLVYILYVGNFTPRDYTPRTSPEKVEAPQAPSEDAPAYSKLDSLTNITTWRRAIDPSAPLQLTINDTQIGTGMPVGCGSKVTITLRGTTPNGANFDETHDEKTPLTFTVGKAPYPVLNEAVLGMQHGGIRHVRSPAERIFPNKPASIEAVLLNITLTKSFDTVPSEKELPITIIPMKDSTDGTPALCGAKAILRVSKVTANGAITPVKTGEFLLGDSGFGAAIDRAAQGMGISEERLVLAPNTQKSPALKDGAVLIERLKKD